MRVIFFLVCLLSVCELSLSQIVDLDTSAIDAITPTIAADGNGHIAVLWGADYANNRHPQKLYHAYSSNGGDTFTFPSVFPFFGDDLWIRHFNPTVAYDGTGKLHFAWIFDNDQWAPVYTKSSNYGLSWRAKVETADLGYNVYPNETGIALATSSDGQQLKLLWYNLPGVSDKRAFCGFSNDGGTTWTTENITPYVTPVTNGQCYMSSAVMDSYGNCFAIAKKENRLSMIRVISGTWDYVDITSTDASISLANNHAIVIDQLDNIYVTWSENGNVYISKSTDNGSTWASAVEVEAETQAQDKPIIGLDTHGELVVAWQDFRDGLGQIRWAESLDLGSSWSSSKIVRASVNDQSEPDMVLIGKKIHLVWIEDGSPCYSLVNRLYGDANESSYVDFVDFSRLADNWQETGSANWSMGDFNGDSNINILDFALLADYWLQSEIPYPDHPPIYNNDNAFPNPMFDDFLNNIPSGWTFQSAS